MLNLYYIRLSDVSPSGGMLAGVKKAAGRVRREKEIGRRLLYFVLTRILHWKPEEIRLYLNEHGKPYLKTDVPLFFNISHSGELVVCAFSDTEVGVDVEKIGKERLAVAERFFHPEEVALLLKVPEKERTELFFRYWSAKESVLKYKGTGLSASLSSFYIRWEGKEAGIYGETGRLPLFLRECSLDKGYKCFICSEQTVPPGLHPLTEDEIRTEDFISYTDLLL